MFYIIEFFRALQFRDYLFFSFLSLPLVLAYIFAQNIETIEKETKEYKIDNNIALVSNLYNKTDTYYFRSPIKEACHLFNDHIEAFKPYNEDQNLDYSCYQHFNWDEQSIYLKYIATGSESKIKKATFSFNTDVQKQAVFNTLISEILINNFKITNIENIFASKSDTILNIDGYEIIVNIQENQKHITIQ